MNNKTKLLIKLVLENKPSYSPEDMQTHLGLELVNSIYPYIRTLQKDEILNQVSRGTYELNESSQIVRTIRTFVDLCGRDANIILGVKTKNVLKLLALRPEVSRRRLSKISDNQLLTYLEKIKVIYVDKKKAEKKVSLRTWENTTQLLLEYFGIKLSFDKDRQKDRLLKTVTADTISNTSPEEQEKLRVLNEKAHMNREDYVLDRLSFNLHETKIADVITEQKSHEKENQFAIVGKIEDWKIRYVYNTDNIEGNALTYEEVRTVLTAGPTLVKANPKDVMETTNSQRALSQIFDTQNELNNDFVLRLHRLTQQSIERNAGTYKTFENCVVDSAGVLIDTTTPASKVSERMASMISWYDDNKNKLHAFELASAIHNQFVYIHPFSDGNGRVARLLMNFILIKKGFYPIITPSEEKEKYYNALRLGKTGDMKPFMMYMFDLYGKQMRYF